MSSKKQPPRAKARGGVWTWREEAGDRKDVKALVARWIAPEHAARAGADLLTAIKLWRQDDWLGTQSRARDEVKALTAIGARSSELADLLRSFPRTADADIDGRVMPGASIPFKGWRDDLTRRLSLPAVLCTRVGEDWSALAKPGAPSKPHRDQFVCTTAAIFERHAPANKRRATTAFLRDALALQPKGIALTDGQIRDIRKRGKTAPAAL